MNACKLARELHNWYCDFLFDFAFYQGLISRLTSLLPSLTEETKVRTDKLFHNLNISDNLKGINWNLKMKYIKDKIYLTEEAKVSKEKLFCNTV